LVKLHMFGAGRADVRAEHQFFMLKLDFDGRST
jgi:hypothetical protein